MKKIKKICFNQFFKKSSEITLYATVPFIVSNHTQKAVLTVGEGRKEKNGRSEYKQQCVLQLTLTQLLSSQTITATIKANFVPSTSFSPSQGGGQHVENTLSTKS